MTAVSASPSPAEWLECSACHQRHPRDVVRYQCDCGGLLSVERTPEHFQRLRPAVADGRLASRRPEDRSGVWRFRECILDVPPAELVCAPEGNTNVYAHPALSAFSGLRHLSFKHEGENPTASFKDRGMTVAVTQAKRAGMRAVACASTGNTSASLASYAARAGLRGVVFVPSGKISTSKLAQTLAYGAVVVKLAGDFDLAMRVVRQAADALGIYLVNSINPFRIEGQKAIAWELLQDLEWDPPDWIVLPAGNLGNTSAVGRALLQAHEAGWISRVPRIASVQAAGANPFFQSFLDGFRTRTRVTPETVASAIRIGDPVSHDRARHVIERTNGVVTQVTDAQILQAKRALDRSGIGCEPASACSLAGARVLRESGVIPADARVVGVLTGHLLKDPDAVLLPVEGQPAADALMLDGGATLSSVMAVLEGVL